jgi:hypothetical protein
VSARGVLRTIEGGKLGFWCPGCRQMHAVRVAPAPEPWGFNGDYDRPSFTPSVLVTGRDFTEDGRRQFDAWHAEGCPKPAPTFPAADTRCHSFVTGGQIQFLSDCTHQLTGKTVQLEPF